MKRTALERKTPLKTKAPMARQRLSLTKRASASNKRRSVSHVNSKRWRSPIYLSFVRSLPCALCGRGPVDAHHLIGLSYGLSGMGLTAPDSFAMPLCRYHHGEVHEQPRAQKKQPEWLTDTINRGLDHFTDEPIVGALADALEFIAAKEDAHG